MNRKRLAWAGAILLACGLAAASVWRSLDDLTERNENVLTFDADVIAVNPEEGYSGFEGWGTSLAWWGHIVGQWEEEQAFHELMDLIFDPAKGIGINIVRYNIGGGENPGLPSTLRPGADVPGFQPEEGRWDWEADAGQRRVLLEAIRRGVNIAEAFSNAPPYWMTVSGSVTGADDGGDNLRDAYRAAFADYLTEVVKFYAERHGVVFRTLAPFNEPVSNWWRRGNNQEGAHFSVALQMDIIRLVDEALKAKGLSGTAISAADAHSIDEALAILEQYDEATLARISQVNTHAYNGSKMAELREKTAALGKTLWMSEYGAGGSEPHNHQDMTSVLELAERIMFDLRLMQPAAWIYWQAVEDETAQNNWGWIHANFVTGEARYDMTKQYYAMGQFSKFIRPGSRIIPTGDGRSVAAYHEEDRTLAVVIRNERSAAVQATYDLSAFTYSGGRAEVYETSAGKNMERSVLDIASNGFAIEVPMQSVVTVVIRDVELGRN